MKDEQKAALKFKAAMQKRKQSATNERKRKRNALQSAASGR